LRYLLVTKGITLALRDDRDGRKRKENGLLATFGDSGYLKQNRHERIAGSLLENPFESIENRVTFSLLVGLLSGIHQKWPRASM
jgi:hypothetical protein